jgi:SAM-dependent methyltransferase
MHGYDPATYGDRFADIYDDWYPDADGTVAAVAALQRWTNPTDAVLELGVGTGRLAIPLAAAGRQVWGIDASRAMIDRLAAKPGGTGVVGIVGDMGTGLPDGPFHLVFVALNTFFGLPSAEAQAACFAAVAQRLHPGGRFVIEAFVPSPEAMADADPNADATAGHSGGSAGRSTPTGAERIEVRSMTADCVVLSISRFVAADQRAEGHHVELRHGMPVVLRPWSVRYSTPEQLDGLATSAGFDLESRTGSWAGEPFSDASTHHLSVYRLT